MQTQLPYLDAPGPDVAALLPSMIVDAEAALAGAAPGAIRRIVGAITTVFPAAKVSATEAQMRGELYTAALADLPEDALQAGMMAGLKVWRFFPSIAEMREQAEPFMAERRKILGALRNLSMKVRH